MHYISKNNDFRLGKVIGIIAIISNILLFVIKYWAGMISSSVALVADAWHTLSDSFSSVVLLTGLIVASKPPDKNHPYGHGRAEIIASLVIGFILFAIALNFLYESVIKLSEYKQANYGKAAIIVTAISLIVKEFLAQISFRVAKREDADSLKADGWHHRTDALSSLVILAGIFLGSFFWWIDGVLGIFVALLIFYTAFVIISDSIRPLLGEKPSQTTIWEIQEIGKEVYNGDLKPHHFHIHTYGKHTEITFHIELPQEMELKDASRITNRYTEMIRKQLNIFATIYIDANKEFD